MAKKSHNDHLLDAVNAIQKAQKSLAEKVDTHEKILQNHAENIAVLQDQVMEYRNQAIAAEIRARVPNQELALKYNLSKARISQIKKEYLEQ